MENNGNQSGGGEIPSSGARNIDGVISAPQAVGGPVNEQVNNNVPEAMGAEQTQSVAEGAAPVQAQPEWNMGVPPQPATEEREDYPSAGPYKSPKKSHKVVLIVAILAIVVGVLALFYVLLSEQIIQNDLFPKKDSEQPVVVEPEPEPEPKPQPKPYVATDKSIDYGFLKMEDGEQNLIYSPLSIKYALNLLNDGAGGKTKEQIEALLGDSLPTKYENVENKLSLANAVFIRDSFKEKVSEDYIGGVTEKYNADVLYDEFTDARKIDSWIDQKTFGLIKQSGAQITSDTEMVLANALAIQLDWKNPFDAEDTRGIIFGYAAEESEKRTDVVTDKEVTMMSNSFYEDDARFSDAEDVKAVAMDLEAVDSAELEFVAIMPEEEKLDEFIEEVDDEKIDEILESMTTVSEYNNTPVDVETTNPIKKLDHLVVNIPKFKFDYELEEFGNELAAMGVEDAFDAEKADFSKMASDPLYVSQAIHKANIDFSEEGIKAAAITVFAMELNALMEEDPPVVKYITFDKPFMFLIRDKNTGEKWFVGTVYEPNLWANDKEQYKVR